MSRFHDILKQYWGYSEFRSLQEDIIRSVAEEKKDTLGLMPTGGGKSITFQVPGLASEGICLVVSPLIALMKDQVQNLKEKKIKAEAIFSGLTSHEIEIIFNKCIYGDIKFLYISPERLATELFKRKVKEMKVNLIAIDESHCISQWGYDFRPSYLNIVSLRETVPNVPILAVTATATPNVVSDIQEKLHFPRPNVFKKSFARDNLVYIVRNIEDKLRYLLKIMSREKGSAVVYVRSRKRCNEISEYLKKNGVTADYYHAGLDNKTKDLRQDNWKKGIVQAIVATNAFGMGIDKSDVRVVVHMDLPDSIEAYFQEAGRAGRDGEKAYAVLLYSNSDKVQLQKRIKTSFPEKELIKRVYTALGNFLQIAEGAGEGMTFDFNMTIFAQKFKFNILQAYNSIKILQRAGYLELTDDAEHAARIHFIVERDDLYKFQIENKDFDVFLKFLLRSYTGLFTDYIAINKEYLAKKSKFSEEEVHDYLIKLANLKIIKYIPRKKTPFIVYTQIRLQERYIKLSPEVYSDRKKVFSDKVNAVVNYASNEKYCRSRILLEYFGQKKTSDCGQCDICKRENKTDLSYSEWSKISCELREKLAAKESSLENLIQKCDFPENKVISVVRELLDNRQIIYSQSRRLTWNSDKKL